MITGTGNCFVCLQNRRFQFFFPKYRSYDNTLGNCFFQISSYSRAYVCTHNFRKDKESSSPGLSIGKTKHTIECFHMTSRRPYWCPKTMKRRPCWCPKPVLWKMNSFLMQMISFVPKHLHRCWPHGGKFLLFCVSQSVKTKETNPTRPGSPTPCKQTLKRSIQRSHERN